MALPWFDLTEVRAFSRRLVEDLHRVKAGGTVRGDKMAQTGKRIDKLLEEAAQFENTHRLNFYKKARLLADVRQGLTDKGWVAADTEAIINQLLTNRLRKA
ncbi:MAG: hypothetical protein V4709_02715 [Pseudomonadota bacterium]